MLNGLAYFKDLTGNSYRHFRSTLNDSERKAYDTMVDGFYDYSDRIQVSGVEMDFLQGLFEKMRQDIPGLFFVESTTYLYSPFTKTGTVMPKYRFPKEQTDSTMLALKSKCNEILKDIRCLSDLEKEKVIHDQICKNVTYDYTFVASSFECVGPLLFNKGVCQGISRAAKLLFDLAGIRSIVVYGTSERQQGVPDSMGDRHAWNIVNIDSVFCHLDITFDLTVEAYNVTRYDYFNLTDSEINRDHVIHSAPLPKCTSSKGFYRNNGMFMQTYGDFKAYYLKKIMSGQRDIVFQLPEVSDIEGVKRKISDTVSKNPLTLLSFSTQFQLVSNDSQFVFHLHFQ